MTSLHHLMPQIMLIGGTLIVLVSYFADLLGLGTWTGLGTRHLFGILFGLLLIANGITIWALRDRRES